MPASIHHTAQQRQQRPLIPGIKHLLHAFQTILRADEADLSCEHLQSLSIHTVAETDPDTPDWLPEPHVHPKLQNYKRLSQRRDDDGGQSLHDKSRFLLQPPDSRCHGIASPPLTGFTWAYRCRDTARYLSQLGQKLNNEPADLAVQPPSTPPSSVPAARFAHIRPTQFDNPWEKIIAHGQQKTPDHWNKQWEMVSMLEADGFVGCIAADNSHSALPETVPYRRSELVCLIALICQQLRQNHENSRIAPTVVSFTNKTTRVLQAYVKLPQTSDLNEPPTLYITERLSVSNNDMVAGRHCDDGKEAYRRWGEVMSWLYFGPTPPSCKRRDTVGLVRGHQTWPSQSTVDSVLSELEGDGPRTPSGRSYSPEVVVGEEGRDNGTNRGSFGKGEAP